MYQMFLENQTAETYIEELQCQSAHCFAKERNSSASLLFKGIHNAVHSIWSSLLKNTVLPNLNQSQHSIAKPSTVTFTSIAPKGV
ncbi:hypothetical protein [Vibrio ezurae]|uniref:Uncharacterized protein n=1 Tax=Vibrio ezurae NBRC 102218 TaxID=1219080 RepID=U3CNA0_9VIBR|nr:hypothetical protein [Vibrio ezurae]GAD79588.1 hypothetical protein VEZ01S_19_00020 [Vibrio ezurae NBRC 102218]